MIRAIQRLIDALFWRIRLSWLLRRSVQLRLLSAECLLESERSRIKSQKLRSVACQSDAQLRIVAAQVAICEDKLSALRAPQK
jgi:hypothetical protein